MVIGVESGSKMEGRGREEWRGKWRAGGAFRQMKVYDYAPGSNVWPGGQEPRRLSPATIKLVATSLAIHTS